MKRLIVLLLSVLLLFQFCSFAYAEQYFYTDDLIIDYYIKDDGTACISAIKSRIFPGKEIKDMDLIIPNELGGFPVTEIAFKSFSSSEHGNYRIRSITIPDSIIWMDDDEGPFYDCNSVEEIVVSKNNPVYEVQDGVLFNKVSKTLICYPRNCANTTYDIPEGTLNIAPFAFANTALQNLSIPDSIVNVEYDALSGNKLYSVIVGSGVTNFNFDTYSPNIAEIIVSPDNAVYSSIDGVLFDKAGTTLLYYPGGRTEECYAIPEGVTRIDEFAFHSQFYSPRAVYWSSYQSRTNPLSYIRIPDTITFSNGHEYRESTYSYPIIMKEKTMKSFYDNRTFFKEVSKYYTLIDKNRHRNKWNLEMLIDRYPEIKDEERFYVEKNTADGKMASSNEVRKLSSLFSEEIIAAYPLLSSGENVWFTPYPYVVVCQQFEGHPFPRDCTLLVEIDSLAYYWALQNGYSVLNRDYFDQ